MNIIDTYHIFLIPFICLIFIAISTASYGCLVVWRGLGYFNDALSHAMLLGLVVGALFSFDLQYSAVIFALIYACFIYIVKTKSRLSNDIAIAITTSTAISIALIIHNLYPSISVNLHGFLFGDILLSSQNDVFFILFVAICITLTLIYSIDKLILVNLSEELAAVNCINVHLYNLLTVVMLAFIIGITTKIIGVILTSAMLVIPAATSRVISKNPKEMILYSCIISVSASIAGFVFAIIFDIAVSATVICVQSLFFIVFSIVQSLQSKLAKS